MWKIIESLLTVLEYIFKFASKKVEEKEDEEIRSDPDSVWSDEFGVKRVRDKDENTPPF